MFSETKYVIHLHDAKRAGRHYDLRIQYPKKKALMSFALPKAAFPDFGERFLLIRAPDHSITKWLGDHDPIEKGKYGEGVYSVVQIGTMQILGWSSRFITFVIDGSEINGKFSMIKYPRGGKDAWILIRSKFNSNNNDL